MNNKVNFTKQWMSSLGYLLNNEDFINQNLNQQPGALSNDLRVVFPVGNHLLDFASYNSYGVTPEILEFENNVTHYFTKPYAKAN